HRRSEDDHARQADRGQGRPEVGSHLGAGHRRGRRRPGRGRLHPMNGHGQTGETTELCTWTLDAERDLWRLGIVVAEEDIPTDRRPGDGQSLFADLNGIAGRTDVARGIMTRYEGPSGGGFAIDLDVPRGFRGGPPFWPVPGGRRSATGPPGSRHSKDRSSRPAIPACRRCAICTASPPSPSPPPTPHRLFGPRPRPHRASTAV